MSRCDKLSVVNRRTSAALIALTVVIGIGACGSSKTGTDAAAGAGGGGSHGGAGGSNGGAGGSSGGTGGSSAGTGGQAGGGGGQQDAGSCRMYGQSCGVSQPCCVPMICAGGCTMPVSQDASSDGLGSGGRGGATGTGGAAGNAGAAGGRGGSGGGGTGGTGACGGTSCPSNQICVHPQCLNCDPQPASFCADVPVSCSGTPTCSCLPFTICQQNGQAAGVCISVDSRGVSCG